MSKETYKDELIAAAKALDLVPEDSMTTADLEALIAEAAADGMTAALESASNAAAAPETEVVEDDDTVVIATDVPEDLPSCFGKMFGFDGMDDACKGCPNATDCKDVMEAAKAAAEAVEEEAKTTDEAAAAAIADATGVPADAPPTIPEAPKPAPVATPDGVKTPRSKADTLTEAYFVKDSKGKFILTADPAAAELVIKKGDTCTLENPRSKHNGKTVTVMSYSPKYGVRGTIDGLKYPVEFKVEHYKAA